MKKSITVALFFLALTHLWSKQNMAWEISYFDDKKVYLIGSIHAGTPEMYPLSEEIMTAFRESDKIAVEANQEAEIDGNLLQKEMKKANYNEGTMKDSIPSELYDKLIIRFQSLGINPSLYQTSKPWYLSMVLQSKQVEKAGLQIQYGIDHYFIQEAAKLNKPILEVEGVLRQLHFLSDLPDSTQHLLLNYTLMEFETYEEETQQLAKIWMDGDTKELENLILKTYLEYEEMKPLFHTWIVERNYEMAEKIIQYISSDDTVFVIVGAAHVVGQDGILQILRRKGYFIKRL